MTRDEKENTKKKNFDTPTEKSCHHCTRRSQNTSYLPYNLDLDNNYPQQYPITHKNSPNYPKLPISLANINSSRNTTRYPENNPPCSGNNANCLTTTNYLYNTYFYSKFTFARHNTWYTDFVRRRKAVR